MSTAIWLDKGGHFIKYANRYDLHFEVDFVIHLYACYVGAKTGVRPSCFVGLLMILCIYSPIIRTFLCWWFKPELNQVAICIWTHKVWTQSPILPRPLFVAYVWPYCWKMFPQPTILSNIRLKCTHLAKMEDLEHSLLTGNRIVQQQ